jgi:hypothetical protein
MWLPTRPRSPIANTAAVLSEDGMLQRTRQFGGFFVLSTSMCLTSSGLARKNAPGVFVACHPCGPSAEPTSKITPGDFCGRDQRVSRYGVGCAVRTDLVRVSGGARSAPYGR